MASKDISLHTGMVAPDFQLTSSNGERIDLSVYKGHENLILYFMREFT